MPVALPNAEPVWGQGPWPGLAPLSQDTTAELCVVGLGGTGLAVVLEAARRGIDVIGIDAGAVAGGAAGRNGGFLLAGIAPFHHDAVAQLGRERAVELYRLTAAEIVSMREATPGSVRLTGSLRIAEDDDELDDCEAQYRQMTADGLPVERYVGREGRGLLFPFDCVCDPLERCRALANRALARGVRLYEHTPATGFSARSVETPRAAVSCDRVIVAVDGGLDSLVPEVAHVVRTARLQMLATAPLGETVFDRPVYRRYGYEYYQQLQDGRLALGGFRDRGGPGEWTHDPEPGERVQELLERFLRDSLGVAAPVTHRWAASVGFSSGPLPLLATVRGGAVVLGGYSGTGNVVGSLLGRAAVAVALDEVGTEPAAVAELFAPVALPSE